MKLPNYFFVHRKKRTNEKRTEGAEKKNVTENENQQQWVYYRIVIASSPLRLSRFFASLLWENLIFLVRSVAFLMRKRESKRQPNKTREDEIESEIETHVSITDDYNWKMAMNREAVNGIRVSFKLHTHASQHRTDIDALIRFQYADRRRLNAQHVRN